MTTKRYTEIICNRCGMSSGHSELAMSDLRKKLGWIQRFAGEKWAHTKADYCKGCAPFVNANAQTVLPVT